VNAAAEANTRSTDRQVHCQWWRLPILFAVSGATLAGCFPIHERAKTTAPSSNVESCNPSDERKWDLGTGHIKDIVVKEPNFYDLKSSARNESLLHALSTAALVGVRLDEVDVGTAQLLHFRPIEKAFKSTLRALQVTEQQTAILLSVSECPHVQVQTSCVDGRLAAKVHANETIPCIGNRSAPLWIAIGNDDDWQAIEDAVPHSVFVPGETVHVRLRLGNEGEPAWRGKLRKGDITAPVDSVFGPPSPKEILGWISADQDAFASLEYRHLPPELKTAGLDEEVLADRQLRGVARPHERL
jgi:hypothetical protein